MPRFLVPHKSGVHRVAAIALYRALLTQCRSFPAAEQHQRDELQNIVRNRFKQARHEQSSRRLRVGFEAGYEAIDHLDAAVAGNGESKSYVLDLLASAPEKVKLPPPLVISKTLQRTIDRRNRPAAPSSRNEDRPEGERKLSLFDRPLPLDKLSGRRHVPVLFNAQGIPVLRIKKPQPQNLSSYINNRIQQRQRRHDLRHKLEDELEIARLEDRWDEIVSGDIGDEGRDSVRRAQEPGWGTELALGRREVNRLLEEERRKNQEMAERMQEVVDREQELHDEERKERRRMKRTRSAAGPEVGESSEGGGTIKHGSSETAVGHSNSI